MRSVQRLMLNGNSTLRQDSGTRASCRIRSGGPSKCQHLDVSCNVDSFVHYVHGFEAARHLAAAEERGHQHLNISVAAAPPRILTLRLVVLPGPCSPPEHFLLNQSTSKHIIQSGPQLGRSRVGPPQCVPSAIHWPLRLSALLQWLIAPFACAVHKRATKAGFSVQVRQSCESGVQGDNCSSKTGASVAFMQNESP